jgi:hypothetical protein
MLAEHHVIEPHGSDKLVAGNVVDASAGDFLVGWRLRTRTRREDPVEGVLRFEFGSLPVERPVKRLAADLSPERKASQFLAVDMADEGLPATGEAAAQLECVVGLRSRTTL